MASGGARSGSGRPRKPTALHVIQGTERPGRINKDEPKPPPVEETTAPAWLDFYAREFWDMYAPKLAGLGLLTEVDLPSFATACEQHGIYRRLMAVITKTPFGKRAKEVTPRAYKALQERDRILSRFGFDPASRTKLVVEPKKPDDEFENLIARGKA